MRSRFYLTVGIEHPISDMKMRIIWFDACGLAVCVVGFMTWNCTTDCFVRRIFSLTINCCINLVRRIYCGCDNQGVGCIDRYINFFYWHCWRQFSFFSANTRILIRSIYSFCCNTDHIPRIVLKQWTRHWNVRASSIFTLRIDQIQMKFCE